MREYGYSDEGLRRLVHWHCFETFFRRQKVFRWVGHVARMPNSRLPKIALFGWPVNMDKHRSCRVTFPAWSDGRLNDMAFLIWIGFGWPNSGVAALW